MSDTDTDTLASAPISSGERCTRSVRYSRAQIADFARLCGDDNPLHYDPERAHRARHGDIIASGQQTVAQLMGLAATWFSRTDGEHTREVLCLNFNFSFKAPVFAEQDLALAWEVGLVEWSERLGGWIGQLDGSACAGERTCVIGRGTMLVKSVGRAET